MNYEKIVLIGIFQLKKITNNGSFKSNSLIYIHINKGINENIVEYMITDNKFN